MNRIAALLAVALCACAPQHPKSCAFTASRDVAFLGAQADDTVTTRALGPSCDKAIAVLEIANAEGHPIYAFAAPLPRVFGEAYLAPAPDDVEALMQRWASAGVETTAAAPAWPDSMLHLPAGAHITLDRATYADIRARALPMLCHLSSPARETCVFYEPGAAGAGLYFERDIEEPAQ